MRCKLIVITNYEYTCTPQKVQKTIFYNEAEIVFMEQQQKIGK